ncbi:hypothetical protein NPS68_25220, partial [Escherichia coli]
NLQGLSAVYRPQNAFGIQPQAPAAILTTFVSVTILLTSPTHLSDMVSTKGCALEHLTLKMIQVTA